MQVSVNSIFGVGCFVFICKFLWGREEGFQEGETTLENHRNGAGEEEVLFSGDCL